MASTDVLPLSMGDPNLNHVNTAFGAQLKRKRPKEDVPVTLVKAGNDAPPKVNFDPAKHLDYEPPQKIWTMEELEFSKKRGLSKCCIRTISTFTEEAVNQMRAEILSNNVLENCKYSSNLAHCQLRGFAPEYAPFVYDAWRSPEILAIVSKIAGIELVPQMDFEIAHINISNSNDESKAAVREALQEKAHREADEGVSGCPWEDDQPIVDWHTDSYPFVCVTMLSDCTNMVGGETALRKGNGEIMKVRGPGMGHAVVLQGRYIEHQAMRVLGTTERISMVTSFRPKSAFARDDTVLTTVRSISDLSELYSQYSEYRFEMLEERIRAHLKEIRDRKRVHRGFKTKATKDFIVEQRMFLESMLQEMVDDEQVIKGFTDDSHLLSDELKVNFKKRARIDQ